MDRINKITKVKLIIACVLTVFACVISTVSLFLPPQGEIDRTVLYIVAELFIFVSILLGLDLSSKSDIAKMISSLGRILEEKDTREKKSAADGTEG